MPDPNPFDAFYFANCLGKRYERSDYWLEFFDTIAARICEEIAPTSVLDAGCAMGFLVEALRKRGVEAFGIDISEYAISQVDPSIRDFCSVGSILEPFPRQYDLVVTIEVLEHLEKADSETALRNICSAAQDVLFSSSPDDFKESTHFNVQPPEYWAEQFARQGFYRDLAYDAGFITPWAVRFRQTREPAFRVVGDYERSQARLIKEARAQRELNQELQHNLARTQGELDFIKNSLTYRFSRRLRDLVPVGSKRERWLMSIFSKFV